MILFAPEKRYVQRETKNWRSKKKKEAEENRKDINRTRSGGKSENAGKREREGKMRRESNKKIKTEI